MLATWSTGVAAPASRALAVLVLLLEQLLDDERQVVADEARAVHQQQPADDRASGTPRTITVPRTPIASVRKPGDEAAEEAADEEDVHRRHRGAHARAAGTGTTACSTGPTIANARRGEHRLRDAEDRRTSAVLCIENCSGVKSADGRISTPTSASALAGFVPVRRGRSSGRRTAGAAARRCR